MTVYELIKALERFPSDLKVVVQNHDLSDYGMDLDEGRLALGQWAEGCFFAKDWLDDHPETADKEPNAVAIEFNAFEVSK